MSILENVLKVGDWIQNKVKTKSGIFVLGTLIGAFPSGTATYLLYQDGKVKDERIIEEYKKISAIELEKDKWQERAFDAENTCMEKIDFGTQ